MSEIKQVWHWATNVERGQGACIRLPNEDYLLRYGWAIGPAVEDLLRDAARWRLIRTWSQVSPLAWEDRTPEERDLLIDAEIARERTRRHEGGMVRGRSGGNHDPA